jgi:hypothetical protein
MLKLLSISHAGGKKKSLNVGSKGGSAGLEDYVYSDDGGEPCCSPWTVAVRSCFHLRGRSCSRAAQLTCRTT